MSKLMNDITEIKKLEQAKENIEGELEELKVIENPLTKDEYYHSGLREGLSTAWTLVNLTLLNAEKELVEDD
jgi:hypothetical protein